MPWSNQSGGGGGPWGGGGGPWGSGGGGGSNRGNNGSGGPVGGGQPPDLEEMIRKGQDRLKTILPGGGSGGGTGASRGLVVLVVLSHRPLLLPLV